MMRIAFAFIGVALLYPAIAFFSGGKFGVGGLFAIASFTVPAALIFGFPVYLLFRQRGWLSCQRIALAAAGIGLICAFPFALGGVSMFVQIALTFAVIGAIHGLLFWFLGVWRNSALTLHIWTPPKSKRPDR